MPRQRRSHYVLYDSDGDEVARVEAHVPAAVSHRRAGRVAVGAAAGVLGIPFVGAVGVAAVASLAATAAVRQIRDWVDPLDVASELRILRGDQTIGVFLRQPVPGTIGPGTSTVPPTVGVAGARLRDRRARRPFEDRGPPPCPGRPRRA